MQLIANSEHGRGPENYSDETIGAETSPELMSRFVTQSPHSPGKVKGEAKMSKTTLICRLAVAFIGAIATVAIGQPAFSDPVWNVGGSVSVDGTNAPNNFSQTTTLTLGTTTIDSGALNLTSSIVDEPGGAEWLVLDYSTVSGAPIVGNVNSSWQLQALEPLSNPANSLGYYFDWSSNGTLLTPTQSFGGGTPGTNPITGSGTVFVNNTFAHIQAVATSILVIIP